MTEEEAYATLVNDLEKANKKFQKNNYRGQTMAVMAVVQYLQARKAPDHAFAGALFGAAVTFMNAEWYRKNRGKSGPVTKSFAERAAVALAAAGVSEIRRRSKCSIDEAANQVARLTGLSKKEILNRRNAFSRREPGATEIHFFERDLTELEKLTDAELNVRLKQVRSMSKLYDL